MQTETKIIESLSDLLSHIPSNSGEFETARDLLDQLQQFFDAMRGAESEELQNLMVQWDTQSPLFHQLGTMVRSFYEQMKALRSDLPERLGEIAQHDMVDTSERLHHVVEMTEAAANKTMDLAEALLEDLGNRTEGYDTALKETEHTLETADLPEVVIETLKHNQALLQKNKEAEKRYQGQLTDILIAQNYQDLTGQIVNKTLSLLNNFEEELVSLITTYGKVSTHTEKAVGQLQGPLGEKSEEKKSQGDVDDLLNSLGF